MSKESPEPCEVGSERPSNLAPEMAASIRVDLDRDVSAEEAARILSEVEFDLGPESEIPVLAIREPDEPSAG
jgi:hypothetical protein